MNEIALLANQAARAAGDWIRKSANDIGSLSIEQKTLHDYVSEVDRGAEKIIVDMVRSRFPDHQIVGEEYGTQGSENGSVRWVIDPLDGTTNFLRQIPHYAVSIGVFIDGEMAIAMVYDPAKDEMFSAVKGQGAQLNSRLITVSDAVSVRGALLATGVPYSGENLESLEDFTATMTGLLNLATSGIRRLGAAALDLAYVAAGRYDGFWESNLKEWDIAAGVLLVQEAGGVVTDLLGNESYLVSGDVLAASPRVHPDMLSITEKHY